MSSNSQHLYEFGPFRLDIVEKVLMRDGEPVPLTPKAFDTLVALVERSGHLVGKDELMRVVWADAFVEESNVTNNVYALRKMLGQSENGKSYIETVPKRGYRFTAPVKELSPEVLVVEKRALTRVVTEETLADDDSLRTPLIGAGEALVFEQPRPQTQLRSVWPWLLITLLSVSVVIGGIVIYRSLTAAPTLTAAPRPQIESIAVLPFKNESGNPDMEYLSDGMTETLINSLSQLSNLSVKARSSVFRYKDKTVEPQTIATELSVQAVLTGRVVQRGDDLALYLSLVDGRNGDQIWGEQYNRKLADLVAVQGEIAGDVSKKLRALSGADQQKVIRNDTQNNEAYQLYLKGRYHVARNMPSEIQRGISYFQQAIEVDPNYALAYTNLAGAYLTLALNSEIPATEVLPKAKTAANRAVEIDGTLAEAHAELANLVFWYDWNWAVAEAEFKRALELNPNDPTTVMEYAAFLANTGRYAESIQEIKRAVELDPLDAKTKSLEGIFLIRAGQFDDGLAVLQKALEMDPNHWPAHLFAVSGYVGKGMLDRAMESARKAREIAGDNPQTIAFVAYTLAKSGKRPEAKRELGKLLRLSNQRYVSPKSIAMVYQALGHRDQTLEWLERAYEVREPRLTLLKVERGWDFLRDEPRFQDLLRRVGLS